MTTTPTASPELLDLAACPFCGGTEAFVERADYSAAFVVCDSRVDEHSVCMARGPIGIQDDDGEEVPGQAAAIREWNKAAALARRAQPESGSLEAELKRRMDVFAAGHEAAVDYIRSELEKARAALAAQQAAAPGALEPVDYDLLPPVGSKVLIHLARQDEWVEHTVTGYYVWPAHKHQVKEGEKNAHRVFVRVKDGNGYDNARLLSEFKAVTQHAGQPDGGQGEGQ